MNLEFVSIINNFEFEKKKPNTQIYTFREFGGIHHQKSIDLEAFHHTYQNA